MHTHTRTHTHVHTHAQASTSTHVLTRAHTHTERDARHMPFLRDHGHVFLTLFAHVNTYTCRRTCCCILLHLHIGEFSRLCLHRYFESMLGLGQESKPNKLRVQRRSTLSGRPSPAKQRMQSNKATVAAQSYRPLTEAARVCDTPRGLTRGSCCNRALNVKLLQGQGLSLGAWA